MPRITYLSSATLLLACLGGYSYWAEQRPAFTPPLSDVRITLALNHGTPGTRGNLLGIQPELFASDYHSSAHLRLKLSAYLDQARSEGLVNAKTVAVLPEHIGTWLVASGEKPEVYQAPSVDQAMVWLALGNPLRLLRSLLAAAGNERLSDALFRMKAQQMAAHYQALFGGLAKEYGITLVAGSIVLPQPEVRDGQLITGNGPLYNVSIVFGSDGHPLGQPQRKAFPIREEQGFTAAADIAQLQSVETPAGRLGVLICADSWYPSTYQQLALEHTELLAVPAFLTGNGTWDKPWGGYNGAATPADVTLKAGDVSEGQAWQRLSMPGRIGSSGAKAGITVFMRGQLWDMGSDGHSMISHNGQPSLAEQGPGARLVNLWL